MIYDNNKENDVWQQRKWYMTTTNKMIYDNNKENDIWQQQSKCGQNFLKETSMDRNKYKLKFKTLKKTFKKEKHSQV